MATELVVRTLCDVCQGEGQDTDGAMTYRLGLNPPNETRWGWTEVDLCPDHAVGLTDLSVFLSKYGRAFQPEDPKASVAAQARICPQCGKTYKTQDSLGKHLKSQHSEAPGSGSSGPFVCDVDGCGRSFPKAQGLSMHQRRTHQGFDPNA